MEELREAVARGRIIFVVGTGLSMSSSGNATCASWLGFIESSLGYIADRGMAPDAWQDMLKQTLKYATDNGDVDTLISAAGMIQNKVAESGTAAVSNWLRDTLGSLTPTDTSWPIALDKIGCPILTTNYDHLIELATGRETATWQNSSEIQKILVNNSTKVGHLHGFWGEQESVVLSQSDYTRLLNSDTAQELQKAASLLKSIVYVGVGAGLTDPNFSRLIDWHRKSFGMSGHRHYRLCRASEVGALMAEHRSDHIVPVPYGSDYSDLPVFLNSLVPSSDKQAVLSSTGQVLDPTHLAIEALADQVRMQSIVCENVIDRDSRGVADLVVPPVLFPVSADRIQAAETIADTQKIKRSDPLEVGRLNGVTVIVGGENTGLTTALQWLLDHAASTSGVPPILVDFNKFTKGGQPLVVQLRTEARALNLLPSGAKDVTAHVVVGIDNVTPYAGRLCDQMIQDLIWINPRQVFIGCRLENEAELVERLVAAGMRPEVRYVGRFGRQDVIKLVSLASATRPESVATRVLSVMSQQNLPRTPFIVSLLASILLAGNSISANSSHTSLLDQYLSQLLGRGNVDEDARWSVDVGLREAVLADLAMLFVEKQVGSLPGSSVIARIETYFEKRDISESAVELLEYFRAQRVVRSSRNLIRFSHHSYLYLFAAKAAAENVSFRELILGDPTLFAPIIRHYASLKRQDADLLTRLEKYLDEAQHLTADRVSLRQVAVVEAPTNLEIQVEFLGSSETDGRREENESGFHPEDGLLPYEEPEAFPLSIPDDLPAAFRYSIVLDVVSTALRDCDQVPDPELKALLLRKVLAGWGRYLGLLSADPILKDAFRAVAEITAQTIEVPADKREEFIERATAIFPPIMTMSGISASLSSRKLLKALDKAIDDRDFTEDAEGAIAAAFMLFDIQEAGWASKLSGVTAEHNTLEIVALFFKSFCTYLYFSSSLNKEDEAALLHYICELSVAGYKFSDPRQKNHNMTRIEQALKTQKLQKLKISAARTKNADSQHALPSGQITDVEN
jgi:hypothetical protein